jgi:hypothetical protein
VTKNTSENWKNEKTPEEFNKNAKGYSYLSDDNIQMVEFHVDNHTFLHSVMAWWEEIWGSESQNRHWNRSWFLGKTRVFSISFLAADNGLDLKDSVRFYQRQIVWVWWYQRFNRKKPGLG